MLVILGDVHNRFTDLNLIFSKLPDEDNIAICCGDLGFFPNIHVTQGVDTIDTSRCKLYFCPGNHEDWDSLDQLAPDYKITEIYSNVFYCPFGSILSLPEYGNFLFCGGAESVDRHRRTPGYDWFAQEGISNKDIAHLPDPTKIPIDTVISHTAPVACILYLNLPRVYNSQSSSEALNLVYDIYKPKTWYFGHFHRPKTFKVEDTLFHSLGHIQQENFMLAYQKSADLT